MGDLFPALIDAARLPAGEPDWLREARTAARSVALAEGSPSPRSEAWKYTSLRALQAREFAAVDAKSTQPHIDAAIAALPGVGGPRLVFVNGVFRADLSQLSQLPDGLQIRTLASALNAEAEDWRAFYASVEPASAFAGLTAALANDGVTLRVAPGVRVEAPVHLLFVGAPAAADIAWHLRTLIDLGEQASVSVIEQHLGSATHRHLANAYAQYRLQSGSTLNLIRLQREGDGASLIQSSEFILGERASLLACNLDIGVGLARHDWRVRLQGNHARCVSRGVFALNGRQHVDNQLTIEHRAPDTSCDLLWRGVADGRSRGVFNGTIRIAANCPGSAARLSNKNLLLSAHAEIDTKPVLEILTDAVQASHGATVGQLDERALFYLRSRGLSRGQARQILTHAFCREALDGVEDHALREHLAMLISQHLPNVENES
jgi:Fe-S cluster assembly protein SufD